MKSNKIIKFEVEHYNIGDLVYYRDILEDPFWIHELESDPWVYIEENSNYTVHKDTIYLCKVLKVNFKKSNKVEVEYDLEIIDSSIPNKVGTKVSVKKENACLSYFQSYALFPNNYYNVINTDLVVETFIKEVINPTEYGFEEFKNCIHIIHPGFTKSIIVSKLALKSSGYQAKDDLEKNIIKLKNNYKQLNTCSFGLYVCPTTYNEHYCYCYEFEDDSLNFYVNY